MAAVHCALVGVVATIESCGALARCTRVAGAPASVATLVAGNAGAVAGIGAGDSAGRLPTLSHPLHAGAPGWRPHSLHNYVYVCA